MPDTYQYSMNDYWTMLIKDMETLQASDKSYFEDYSPLKAALIMAKKGLTFEAKETGALSLEPTMNEIVKLSVGIGPKVELTRIIQGEQKTHEYHLPDISNTNTLLFAILYHKHLTLFQSHTYKGPYGNSWPLYIKSKIDAKTDSKRPWSEAQAEYLKAEIKKYITTHELSLSDDDLFPANESVTPADFIAKLRGILTPTVTAIEETEDPPSVSMPHEEASFLEAVAQEESSELDRLIEEKTRLSLDLNTAKQSLKAFNDLLTARNLAKQAYTKALREYKREPKASYFFSHVGKDKTQRPHKIAETILIEKQALIAQQLSDGDSEDSKLFALQTALNETKIAHKAAISAITTEERRLEEEKRPQETLRLAREETSRHTDLAPRSAGHNIMLAPKKSQTHPVIYLESDTVPEFKASPQQNVNNTPYGFFDSYSTNELIGAGVAAAVSIGMQYLMQ